MPDDSSLSIESRLEQLRSLYEKNLIDEETYREQCKIILAQLTGANATSTKVDPNLETCEVIDGKGTTVASVETSSSVEVKRESDKSKKQQSEKSMAGRSKKKRWLLSGFSAVAFLSLLILVGWKYKEKNKLKRLEEIKGAYNQISLEKGGTIDERLARWSKFLESYKKDRLAFKEYTKMIGDANANIVRLKAKKEKLAKKKKLATEKPKIKRDIEKKKSSKNQVPIPKGFRYLRTKTYSCGGETNRVEEYLHRKTGMEFVLILGGSFQMSSNDGVNDEKPVHNVVLKPFLMGKYEVTQKAWRKVMGKNPSYFKGDNRPVEKISWNDIQSFLQKTELELPTEAQWEYACRGGTQKTQYHWGSDNIDDYAWYWDNSDKKTHPVGEKKPNAYGLYDMSGNVWEWCRDGRRKYTSSAENDPIGPMSSPYRVYRGGSWLHNARDCCFTNRYCLLRGERHSGLGFRASLKIEKLGFHPKQSKPRKILVRITYNIQPPKHLSPYTLTMAPMDNPNAEKPYKEGDMIKPNSYILRILRIKKEAYEPIEIKKHVQPDESPLVINEQLIAKQVTLHIKVNHNVPPPPGLEMYTVSLINETTLGLNLVTHGKKIKPGNYRLDIQRPGYRFGSQKPIQILPSEKPYLIEGSLIARPGRRFSFDMVDPKTGILVPVHEVINVDTNKTISFKDQFAPGSQLKLIIKFKKYQTVKKTVKIEPGPGPLVVHVPLKKLTRYDFNLRKKEIKLDKIKYPYEFYVDERRVESHLISIERGVGRYYFTLWVSPEAQRIKMIVGYLFSEGTLKRGKLSPPNDIDMNKFMEHLNKVSSKGRGRRASLETMEKMLKTFMGKRRLKKCKPSEVDQLIQFIDGWTEELKTSAQRLRIKVVTEQIVKLKR